MLIDYGVCKITFDYRATQTLNPIYQAKFFKDHQFPKNRKVNSGKFHSMIFGNYDLIVCRLKNKTLADLFFYV